jgi:hypothetical protein
MTRLLLLFGIVRFVKHLTNTKYEPLPFLAQNGGLRSSSTSGLRFENVCLVWFDEPA